jgi:hypothetical protein
MPYAPTTVPSAKIVPIIVMEDGEDGPVMMISSGRRHDPWRRCSDRLVFDKRSMRCMVSLGIILVISFLMGFSLKILLGSHITHIESFVVTIIIFFCAIHCIFRCGCEDQCL